MTDFEVFAVMKALPRGEVVHDGLRSLCRPAGSRRGAQAGVGSTVRALRAGRAHLPSGGVAKEHVTVYRPLVEASDLKWHLSVVEWGRGREYALGRGAAGQDRSSGSGTGQAGPRADGQGSAHRGTRANHRRVGAAREAASGPVLEGRAVLGSEATRPQAG